MRISDWSSDVCSSDLGQLEKIGTQQGFAAGQDEYAHAGRMQIVDDVQGFVGAEFIAEWAVGRSGVAMLASEAATPQQVQDHHGRAERGSGGGARTRSGVRLDTGAQEIGRAGRRGKVGTTGAMPEGGGT